MNSSKKKIALVGAGISALETAYSLVQNSPELISSLTFFEKNNSIGGVLTHTRENKFLLEHGAQGVLLSRPSFQQCLDNLNIRNKIILPPKKLGTRYLIRNNKCVPLSANIFFLLKEKLINLNSIIKIIRVFIFNKQSPPFFNESLYDFFYRHLGKKIAQNFLIPFCFGIWGGGAQKLLARFYFPQFPKLSFKKKPQGLASFDEGMAVLPYTLHLKLAALCEKNNIPLVFHFSTAVTSLCSEEEKIKVTTQMMTGMAQEIFDIVIYAGQPWRDLTLKFEQNSQAEKAFDMVKNIPNHSITVVGLGGEKSPDFHYKNGFGALENSASQDLLGILFIHSTYPSHVPKNHFLYRVLLGGDRNTSLSSLSEKELLTRSKTHLKNLQLLKGDEKISFQKVIRYENYIPLATSYQDEFLTALWQLESLHPGLFFTGNYIQGVSVAECLEQGNLTAKKVVQFILEQG